MSPPPCFLPACPPPPSQGLVCVKPSMGEFVILNKANGKLEPVSGAVAGQSVKSLIHYMCILASNKQNLLGLALLMEPSCFNLLVNS